MPVEVTVALITFLGSVIGTFGGIMATNKLTSYRIEQLEKKVDKHNNLIERTYKLEEQISILDQRESVSEHRLKKIEGEQDAQH